MKISRYYLRSTRPHTESHPHLGHPQAYAYPAAGDCLYKNRLATTQSGLAEVPFEPRPFFQPTGTLFWQLFIIDALSVSRSD